MITTLKSFAEDENGATAIEYGLIAALVSVAAIASLDSLGSSLVTMFSNVTTEIESATGD